MTKKQPYFQRVKMVKTMKKEVGKGSYVTYQARGLYLLDKTEADKLIKDGFAVDPNKPKKGAK